MSAGKWTRFAPGLYVDPSERWVVSREDDRSWYSIRRCLGYGPLLDGVTMFPDMGGTWYGDYHSLADAKAAVERMVADGYDPILETLEAWTLAENTAKAVAR